MISETKRLKAELFDSGEQLDRVTAERDSLRAQNEKLRKVLSTIRDESSDLGACECAADALVDNVIMSISKEKSQAISQRGRDAIVHGFGMEEGGQ